MIEIEANALTHAVRQTDHDEGQRLMFQIFMHLFNLVVY